MTSYWCLIVITGLSGFVHKLGPIENCLLLKYIRQKFQSATVTLTFDHCPSKFNGVILG